MSWIALKMLTGNRGKYLGIILGIAFASLLIAQQASIFCGLMLQTSGQIRDIQGASIWVMDRNVQFSELNLAAFKDIVAASKDQNILTLEFRPQTALPSLVSFSIASGDEGYAPVTLAVPSLLFDDVIVRKVRGETANPPITQPPYFDHN